ncbi:MAG: TetR/AcrR family transcriptional regulator [bacterium]
MKNDTEQIILNAARVIFKRKGFAGARMQEIADEAKINKAMLHYYYTSKELLFSKVFHEVIDEFLRFTVKLLDDKIDWKLKIKVAVCSFTDFFINQQDILPFVINEIHQNQTLFEKQLSADKLIAKTNFFIQINEAAKNKEIKNVDPIQILVDMMSLVSFPLLAKPMIQSISGYNDDVFKNFIEYRKELIVEMILKQYEL